MGRKRRGIAGPGPGITILLFLIQAGFAGCGAPGAETPNAAPDANPAPTAAPFADVTDAVGLDFVHVNGMSGKRYFVEMVGSGGALFDYDNDGDLDLYAVQGHALAPAQDASSAPPKDRLYRNDLDVRRDGSRALRFTDVTDTSGLDARGYGMGVATGDYNNDGHIDLYVLNWGSNQLWRNNGDGTFSDVTRESGTDDPRWSTGASFLDADRDGRLDLMVVNYDEYTLENDHPCYGTTGRLDYCGPSAYPAQRDRFFRNRGDGTFEDATFRMGLANAYGPALGVITADFNLDGWPDLYVTNDGEDNLLWINQAGHRFSNRAVMGGVAVNAAGRAEASMGVNAADFDNDGDEDLFMTHLNGETNTLYVNTGDALFEDRTRRSGLGLPSRLFTAFGVAPLDYDNDGWLDLFIANGEVKIITEQVARGDALPLRQPNQLFRNRGQSRFEETTPGDALFALAEVSRGTAYGDVDNDGDTDLVLFNNNGPARLLRNDIGQQRPWLGLRLVDAENRRDLPGTRVALLRPEAPTLWRRAHVDGSYCSAHDPRVLFGLGNTAAYDAVRVYWPDDTVEEWNGLEPGRYHTLVKGQGQSLAEL
ncbi:MAG: CRTAC1 family protein [Rhodothermales bacterium]